jgi:hypothetical protein
MTVYRKCVYIYSYTNFIWLHVSTRYESSSGHFNLLLRPNNYSKWNVSSLRDPVWELTVFLYRVPATSPQRSYFTSITKYDIGAVRLGISSCDRRWLYFRNTSYTYVMWARNVWHGRRVHTSIGTGSSLLYYAPEVSCWHAHKPPSVKAAPFGRFVPTNPKNVLLLQLSLFSFAET